MAESVSITLTINGTEHSINVEPRLLLVHAIRDVIGLTGTHVGCDTSQCGSCTVLLNGEAVKSCSMLAAQADGQQIETVEGLAHADGTLHPIQQAFAEKHGLQCGFCTPGMLMMSKALLNENPNPSRDEIRHALAGNMCRCTGYQNIVLAIEFAAEQMAR
ncbi:MAG: (2Fe-2S)-binding protein [Dehalococcoidia bacterium]|nr:(2Fe-2S)-binding protein [Dehalococcoidia bacterium]